MEIKYVGIYQKFHREKELHHQCIGVEVPKEFIDFKAFKFLLSFRKSFVKPSALPPLIYRYVT